MVDTERTYPQANEDHFVINLDIARFMHRHGDDWAEMSPVPVHSPDSRDPERHLIHGERVFRCNECDEEVRIQIPEAPVR